MHYAVFKNQETKIKIISTINTANIHKGVRQGFPLSPTLFNVYVEQEICDIKQKLVEKRKRKNDLQTALIEMDDIFLTFKLNINTAKTKVMICSKQIGPNINIFL